MTPEFGLPHICSSTLHAALFVSTFQIIFGVTAGLLSIWGWGLAAESVVCYPKRFSFAHAFLQGLVVVALLRAIGSVMGFCNNSGGLAIGGLILAGFFLFRRHREIPPAIKSLCGMFPRALWALFGVSVVIATARQILFPSVSGDTIAIWAYHAKALTCECIYAADYVQEPIWGGTHSEYPLLYPFLHSYLFSLTGSFRDDWARSWMAASILPFTLICLRSFCSRAPAISHTVIFLFALFGFFLHADLEGTVEFPLVLFALLVLFAAWDGDTHRMPLYLLGLAFTKNEGLVAAAVWIPLYALTLRKQKRSIRPLLHAAAGIAVIALFLLSLPSRNEQYTSVLLAPSSWHSRFADIRLIVSGWIQYFFLKEPWNYLYIPAVLLAPLLIRLNPMYRLGWLWTGVMIGIYTVVYVASPCGPDLYKVTIHRIMLPFFLVILFTSLGGTFVELPGNRWKRAASVGYVYLALVLSINFVGEIRRNALRFQQRWNGNQLGANYYLQEPNWKQARSVDAQFPAGARVALLGSDGFNFFRLNYLLYPRKFYASAPDQPVQTWRPWKPWSQKPPAAALGFRYFFDCKDNNECLQR